MFDTDGVSCHHRTPVRPRVNHERAAPQHHPQHSARPRTTVPPAARTARRPQARPAGTAVSDPVP